MSGKDVLVYLLLAALAFWVMVEVMSCGLGTVTHGLVRAIQ